MVKKILIILLCLIVVLGAVYGYVYYKASKVPENNAQTMVKAALPHDKKIVVCFGDSLTHATVSFDYVGFLAKDPDLQNYIFVNEGINSRLVYNLLQVVDTVVALKPHYVFVWIGTNDLKGSLNDKEYQRYNDLWNLPQKPTKEWFEQNYRQLVSILKTKTDAKIVLISLPPLGENIDSLPFKLSMEYSAIIRDIAQKEKLGYIGLNEILTRDLIREGKRDVAPYTTGLWFMYSAIIQHYLFGRDWDTISDSRGLTYMTDNIHINGKAGRILAAAIKEKLISNKK
ncbi:MAG TPA: SGNH/GDSL hydrolase family protein [Spirochaetota bacterium]|nr:SGNH/GDSL hydrolase family protein [Spirochaetota bacterium]